MATLVDTPVEPSGPSLARALSGRSRVSRAEPLSGGARQRPYLSIALTLCVALVVEGSAYGVLAPLLPIYRLEVGLSLAEAGLITGAFSAGMLPANLLILFRTGLSPKALAVVGLCLMTAGAAVLATADSVTALTGGRVVQGFGAGAMFSGSLRWLLRIVPSDRRGLWFGLGWGSLNGGSVLGPAVGTLGAHHGVPLVHLLLGTATALLVGVLLTQSAPTPPERLKRTGTSRGLFLALILPLGGLVAPAVAIGMANTIAPLRLHDLGGGSELIAATFVLAAGLSLVASPLSGRWVDHSGPRAPLAAGLALGTVLALMLTFDANLVVLSVGTILILGVANELAAVAAGSMLDAAGSARRADTAAVLPIVYAVFETLGAFISGPLAGSGAGAPFLVLALVYLAAALVFSLARSALVRPDGRPSRRS